MFPRLLNTASTTLTLLRRDRIFVPIVLSAMAIAIFAQLASDWSVAEFSKVLNDIGFFGFQMTGTLVAIFWGIKMVTDSKTEGSIEVELAAPISRSTWLLGKYLGLVAAFFLLAIVILVAWQAMMLLNDFGWMSQPELVALGFTILGWAVMGAVALLFGCIARQAVALFVTLALWLAGLTSAMIANTLSQDTPESTKTIVQGIARAWDLQQFNLASRASQGAAIPWPDLSWRLAYGVLLVAITLSLACALFSRKDVTQHG
jgi:Cu-processing system permease protein